MPRSLTEAAAALETQMLEGTPALQVVRHCLGQEIPLKVCAAYQKDIPPALRGISANNVEGDWGPPEELIALELGERSGDLAVVGCQSPEDLNWFRQANPTLQNCLVTVWNQWALMWLRADTRPNNVVVPEGWIWLTRGAIPVSYPGQRTALIHIGGPAVQICFATLQWPAVLAEAFLFARLEEKHGSRFRRRRGKTLLRESLWADWLVEISRITYYPKLREFRTRIDNTTETLSEASMFSIVREMLQKAANSLPDTFPISEIKLPRIRQLIRLMKVVACVHEQVEAAAPVQPYCCARLAPRLGETITTAEIWLDYLKHCKEHDQRAYSRGGFLRLLPTIIGEVFDLTKSHDIKRQGRSKRGFRGLCLKPPLHHPNHLP